MAVRSGDVRIEGSVNRSFHKVQRQYLGLAKSTTIVGLETEFGRLNIRNNFLLEHWRLYNRIMSMSEDKLLKDFMEMDGNIWWKKNSLGVSG